MHGSRVLRGLEARGKPSPQGREQATAKAPPRPDSALDRLLQAWTTAPSSLALEHRSNGESGASPGSRVDEEGGRRESDPALGERLAQGTGERPGDSPRKASRRQVLRSSAEGSKREAIGGEAGSIERIFAQPGVTQRHSASLSVVQRHSALQSLSDVVHRRVNCHHSLCALIRDHRLKF